MIKYTELKTDAFINAYRSITTHTKKNTKRCNFNKNLVKELLGQHCYK